MPGILIKPCIPLIVNVTFKVVDSTFASSSLRGFVLFQCLRFCEHLFYPDQLRIQQHPIYLDQLQVVTTGCFTFTCVIDILFICLGETFVEGSSYFCI